MNYGEGLLLGLTQGITEFIPVSSSGHLIFIRQLFGFSVENDLAIDAVLQLATVFAVVVYFAKDIPSLIKDKVMVSALIIGTIPAVIVGVLLESMMETAFRSSVLVAWMLILGALLMYAADWYGKQDKNITVSSGLIVGLFQSLALIPGISRSGATISGGLFAGLNRESAARFSFLLSVPIIAGSGLKKLFDLSSMGVIEIVGLPLLLSSLAAFVTGLLAIDLLIRYLRNHDMSVFIWYRIILAFIILIYV